MSIDPISSSGQNIDVKGLTPDALLVYIQTSLNDLDTDINGYLDKQNQIIAEKKVLHEVEAMLGTKPTNGEELLKLYRDAEAKLAELPPGDPARHAAHLALVNFVKDHNINGGYFRTDLGTVEHPESMELGAISDDQWKDLDQNLKNIGDDASSQGETNMIQLQSLMSRRQTAVQLTTNMMNKLDESYASVVKNI